MVDKKPDQTLELLNALLSSARRRDRALLHSRIELAREHRDEVVHAAYFKEQQETRIEGAMIMPRDDMFAVYDAALEQSAALVEKVARAAIEAGAKDGPIVAYLQHDFCQAVTSYMTSSFGHGQCVRARVPVQRDLVSLESNTRAKAHNIQHRVRDWRAEFERTRATRYRRMIAWVENRPLLATLIGIAVAVGFLTTIVRGVVDLFQLVSKQP